MIRYILELKIDPFLPTCEVDEPAKDDVYARSEERRSNDKRADLHEECVEVGWAL